MRPREAATVAGAVVAAGQLLPSVAAVGPLLPRLCPQLCGRSGRPHVALTFDDGPDPAATPALLATLARLDVRATFFVLGSRVAERPQLARAATEAGHEVAVHGWTHRPDLVRPPVGLAAQLRRAVLTIAASTGCTPRFWRPPHGIPTGAGLRAARRAGLRAVLWTADGRDWQARATPDSIRRRITGRLDAGGVVLLHDSDAFAAPESWRRARAALPAVVGYCRDQGWDVGPLAEHGLGERRGPH